MSLKQKLALILIIVCVFTGYTLMPKGLERLYNRVNPAVVWIGAELGPNDTEYYDDYNEYKNGIKWQGSGFVISSDGLIATAGHVVDNTKTFQLMFSDGRTGKAEFAYQENSSNCDAGFIQITSIGGCRLWRYLIPENFINWLLNNEHPVQPIKNLPYVSLTPKVKIAEKLAIVGYPWGWHPTSTITQGIVAALDRDIDFFGEKFMFHTDTASWPGNSGSAVFNMDGDVVGILVGGMRGSDNYSLCTPAKVVILALNKYRAEKAMEEAK